MFWSIKCIYNIEYKMYLQNKKMTKLWVFVDFSNKRRFVEQLHKTSLQNEPVIWITKRRIRREVFCKKGVLKNITKFTGEHLYWSLFFNKVAGVRLKTLLKKRLQHKCFPVNFANWTFFLKNISGSCFRTKDVYLFVVFVSKLQLLSKLEAKENFPRFPTFLLWV